MTLRMKADEDGNITVKPKSGLIEFTYYRGSSSLLGTKVHYSLRMLPMNTSFVLPGEAVNHLLEIQPDFIDGVRRSLNDTIRTLQLVLREIDDG